MDVREYIQNVIKWSVDTLTKVYSVPDVEAKKLAKHVIGKNLSRFTFHDLEKDISTCVELSYLKMNNLYEDRLKKVINESVDKAINNFKKNM